MKRTITFLWLCLCVWMAGAENYPYRNDVLWVTVPDHADWIYKTNEKAKVELQLYRYGIPQDGLTVVYELADDMMPAYKKDSVVLKNGKAVISLESMKTPGFRDCKLTTRIDGTTYSLSGRALSGSLKNFRLPIPWSVWRNIRRKRLIAIW